MTFDILLAFFISSLTIAAAPGPDNIFVLTQSALYGAKSGILVVLGLCSGILIHTSLVVLGVSAMIAANYYLFMAVKIAGALYLIYLAVMCLKHSSGGVSLGKGARLSSLALYRRGFIMNITNPKVIIFFLAFFPQFIKNTDDSLAVMLQMGVQGFLFLLATLIIFSAFAYAASFLTKLLVKDSFSNALNKISAVIFIALAAFALFF